MANPTLLVDQPHERCVVYPTFLETKEASELMDRLTNEVPWICHVLYPGTVRERKQARLTCSMGAKYAYSGAVHPESPWHEEVVRIMELVNQKFNTTFNACLLNFYQTGQHYISAHSDNEKELGENSAVVSISLGASRNVTLRHKSNKTVIRERLDSGSLFMMSGNRFQKLWTHEIPKQPSCRSPRISLTFRRFGK